MSWEAPPARAAASFWFLARAAADLAPCIHMSLCQYLLERCNGRGRREGEGWNSRFLLPFLMILVLLERGVGRDEQWRRLGYCGESGEVLQRCGGRRKGGPVRKNQVSRSVGRRGSGWDCPSSSSTFDARCSWERIYTSRPTRWYSQIWESGSTRPSRRCRPPPPLTKLYVPASSLTTLE